MTLDSERRSFIGEDFRAAAFVQDYSPKGSIDGVQFLDLRLFLDDGGSFNELLRLRPDSTVEALPQFRVRQSSYSEILPQTVKAWHLHRAQDDLWFVPPSQRLLVGLLDTRAGSPTYKKSMRFVLGGGAAKLVYIPAGVAHGAANPWQQPAAILYFVNAPFDPTAPDEWRLPWDLVGADFWTVQPG